MYNKNETRTCHNCKFFLPIMVTYDAAFRRYFCIANRDVIFDNVTNTPFLRMKQCSEVWFENEECPHYESGEYVAFDWSHYYDEHTEDIKKDF